MKIGERLPGVLEYLNHMNIAQYCSFGRHVGMEDELIYSNVASLNAQETSGYLATMLIRKNPPGKRHH